MCVSCKCSVVYQDDATHSFGHTGGFICPFVPLLPIICILINVYLLINLEFATWMRVSIWLFLGSLVLLALWQETQLFKGCSLYANYTLARSYEMHTISWLSRIFNRFLM